jgi:pimeloyl-ACP methyl ester carboxylesterase
MGHTPAPERIDGNDAVLDLLLGLVDAVIGEEAFLLVGHSYGGYLARVIANAVLDRAGHGLPHEQVACSPPCWRNGWTGSMSIAPSWPPRDEPGAAQGGQVVTDAGRGRRRRQGVTVMAAPRPVGGSSTPGWSTSSRSTWSRCCWAVGRGCSRPSAAGTFSSRTPGRPSRGSHPPALPDREVGSRARPTSAAPPTTVSGVERWLPGVGWGEAVRDGGRLEPVRRVELAQDV